MKGCGRLAEPDGVSGCMLGCTLECRSGCVSERMSDCILGEREMHVEEGIDAGMCVGPHVGPRCGGRLCVGLFERPRFWDGKGTARRRTRFPRFGWRRFLFLREIGPIFGTAKIGGCILLGFPRRFEGTKIGGISGIPNSMGVSTFQKNSKNTPHFSTAKRVSKPRYRWVSRLKSVGNRPIPIRYSVSPFPLFPPFPFRSRLPRGFSKHPNRRFAAPEFGHIPLWFHVSTISTNRFVPFV